jgi:hypothetical protein
MTSPKSHTLEVLIALREALQERTRVISDTAFRSRDPAAHLQALRDASEAIKTAASQLRPPLNRELQHYLERASFDKALAWINECVAHES